MGLFAALLAWFGLGCCIGMTLDAVERPYRRTKYIIVRKKRRPTNIELVEKNNLPENNDNVKCDNDNLSKHEVLEAVMV